MSALLTQYFERYAESAITKMKAALIAVDYYERIKVRLAKKEDLSAELTIIARAGHMAILEQPEATISAIVDWATSPR